MKRTKLLFIGVIVAATLTACGKNAASKEIKVSEPITFVSVNYDPIPAFSYDADIEGYKFNVGVNFIEDNKINASFNLDDGEGDPWVDNFSYSCSQKEIDQMQVSYQSLKNRADDTHYVECVQLGLLYVVTCFDQQDADTADRVLDSLYELALDPSLSCDDLTLLL